MSSRIALMVRGLPPIGIDEAIERFGKYYPEPRFGVWHESPSFTGRVENNSVMFTDSQGSLKGGGGLNAQVMADLRKLQSDFNNYTSQYPNIYTNSPTSESRAKLYRRIGFKDVPNGGQAIDRRIILPEDLPYVQALDGLLQTSGVNKALGNINPRQIENITGRYDLESWVNGRRFSSSETPRERELRIIDEEVKQGQKLEAARLGMNYPDYLTMRSRQAEESMRQRMAERMSRARQRTWESFAPEPNPFASTANIPAPSRSSIINEYDDIPF